jgi:hypothetical protein
MGSPKVDVADATYWLLYLCLRHDCFRFDEHIATPALVFGKGSRQLN